MSFYRSLMPVTGLFAFLIFFPAPSSNASNVRPAGLTHTLAPAAGFEVFGKTGETRSFHTEIGFLETVLSYAPSNDARQVFLLANAYIVARQQKYGIAFFEKVLDKQSDKMKSETQAVYLAAYALLRATHADNVFIIKRVFWVLDTFKILEEASALSLKPHPLVMWASGIIYAQVPGFFGKHDEALETLTWLAQNPQTEPTPGFYREVYRYLGELHADLGNTRLAARYEKRSGYSNSPSKTLFMGWFSTSRKKGLLFAPTPKAEEIIAGRIIALRGFGFSDFHFIVSDDGKHLILIDAGTQPFSAKAAMQYMAKTYPKLPPLSHIIVTHAHWDHIGGHTYFRNLKNEPIFYGRSNIDDVLKRVDRKSNYQQFRSSRWNNSWVADYRPDIAIDEHTEIIIGGTKISLTPTVGGETEDALIVHFPGLKTVFAGDAMMPFYGEPWIEEGNVDGTLNTMDRILTLEPEYVLHGHYAISILYGTSQLLAFRDAYKWLLKETRKHIKNGYSVESIIRLNLIPPGMEKSPEIFLGYIAAYESLIARAGDEMTGIWREDKTDQLPHGLEVIGSNEYGRMLSEYLGLSRHQIKAGIRNMLEGGDNALALQMSIAAIRSNPDSPDFTKLRDEAADRLRSAAQFLNPFKFTVYTEVRETEHLAISAAVK